MFPSLINLTIMLSLVRLTSVYHSLYYMSVNSRISDWQIWKIQRKQFNSNRSKDFKNLSIDKRVEQHDETK